MPNKKSGQQKKQQAKRERRSARRKERAKKIDAQKRDKRALENALEIKRRRRAKFPAFVFQEKHGNPEFVAIIKEVIGRFDFTELDEIEQSTFRLMKQRGAEYAGTVRRKVDADNRLDYRLWDNSLGLSILSHIPDDVKRRFLPVNDVEFQYRGDVIVAKFRSLLTQKSPRGTTYYSRYKPTIDFEGKEYIVGFSTKALNQTCERIGKDLLKKTYARLGDVYAYFEDCQHFEPCTLRDGNPAFSFFDECFDCTPQLRWAKKVLGIKEVDPEKGKLYYRVGYCPIVFDQGFAKAKTLLFPGFNKTPERALDKAHMPLDTRRRLQRLAKDSNLRHLWETDDILALKWFHDNGVPQVIQTTEPLFREDT